MSNGKKKGNKNERNLSKWWQNWSGLEFSRVPASGGLRWKKTDNISGDIICTDDRKARRFPFSIETKFYKDINFEHLILGNKKQRVIEFWEQAIEDGDRSDKIPILFMRYNMMPKNVWFTIVSLKVGNIILKKNKGKTEYPYFIIEHTKHRIMCFNSNDLQNLDYKEFIKTIKIGKRNGLK